MHAKHRMEHAGPEDPSKIKYQAESPDESALVVAAKVLGFFFHRRSTTTIMVQESVGDTITELEYEILNVLEFDSTRKRMSVICRTPDNRIMLYCKVSWLQDRACGAWAVCLVMQCH